MTSAYWKDLVKLHETAFAGEASYTAALEFLEKDQQDQAIAAFRNWASRTSNPTTLVRGAALFDVACARRAFINGNLEAAASTLAAAIPSVPEKIMLSVSADYISAGGDEALLGNWVESTARSGELTRKLVDFFGTPDRVSSLFNLLGPTSAFNALSAIDKPSFDALAKGGFVPQLRELAMLAAFEPRASHLATQLSDFDVTAPKGAQAQLSALLTLAHPVLAPRTFANVNWIGLAEKLSPMFSQATDAETAPACASQAQIGGNAARAHFDWLVERCTALANKNERHTDRKAKKQYEQAVRCLTDLATMRVDDPRYDLLVEEATSVGVAEHRLREFRLLKTIAMRRPLEQPFTLADLLCIKDRAGVDLVDLLSLVRAEDFCRKEAWVGLNAEERLQLTEPPAFALASRAIAEEIRNHHFEAAVEAIEIIADAVRTQDKATRPLLISPILAFVDELTASGTLDLFHGRQLAKRLWVSDGESDANLFQILDSDYAHFSSSETFISLWRSCMLRAFVLGTLDTSSQTTERIREARLRERQVFDEPLSSRVALNTLLGEYDQALDTLLTQLPTSNLSQDERTALICSTYRLALAYAGSGVQRKARAVLVTATDLGLAPSIAAALEIGRLGRASHQSQYLPNVLALDDLVRFYLRLTELMPVRQALLSLEGLPLHHFTSLEAWRQAAAEPERLNRSVAAVVALLDDMAVREASGWDLADFAVGAANIILGNLCPANRPIVAEALANLVSLDERPLPIIDAACEEWDCLRPIWLAAQERGDIARLAKLKRALSLISAAHRLIAAIVVENLSPAEFGKRLLVAKPKPIQLALALFHWLKPGLGQGYLEQLPAPTLALVSEWEDVLGEASVLLQEREGLRQTIEYVVDEVDSFEQLLPLLRFFSQIIPSFPAEIRLEILDFIAPLSDRLVQEGDELGNSEPRRLERSLYEAVEIAGTALEEHQRPGFKRFRLYTLSRQTLADASFPRTEANALLDDSSFVLLPADQEARLRLLFLLQHDEQALTAAERFDSLKGDGTDLGPLTIGAMARRFASSDMTGVRRAITVASKYDVTPSLLYAYDLLSGNSGPAVKSRAESVISSRNGLAVLAEMQRALPGHSIIALDALPLTAFAAPPQNFDDKEVARLLAEATSSVAEICVRLSKAVSANAGGLALTSYLSLMVEPYVQAGEIATFKAGFAALINRFSLPHDPLGVGTQGMHPGVGLFDETVEASLNQHYISDFIEDILAEGLANQDQDRTDASELLDQAERTDELLGLRQRIWLAAIAGRIPTLTLLVKEGGLEALHDGEASALQNFLFDNAASDIKNGRGGDLRNVAIALNTIGESPELGLLMDWLGYWSGQSSLPYLKQVETLATTSSTLAVAISAMEYLPASCRIAFGTSLPAFILCSSVQWSNEMLANIVSRHPSSILSLLESMTNRLLDDERDSMRQAAEVFTKTLLPILPQSIQLACHSYLVKMERELGAWKQSSGTLRKAYSAKIAPTELPRILTEAAKNFGPDVACTIIMTQASIARKSDKLIEIIPHFELYGGFEQARAILTPLLKSDMGVEASLTNLRLAYALGDRDSANEQARTIVASTRETRIAILDRLRIGLFAPVLKGKKMKLLRRLTGLRSSRHRIDRAQAAAKASMLLNDPEQTRQRFAGLTHFAPNRFAPSEIGVLILLGDFVGAESVTTRLIDQMQANRQRSQKPVSILQKLEKILPLIAVQQAHFLNEGRDPNFLPPLKALAIEISPKWALLNLKPADSKRVTDVLIKLLRLNLRATSVDQTFDTHCIESVLAASNGDDAICARLGQTLAANWHARGGEIGHRALSYAVSALKQTLGRSAPAKDEPIRTQLAEPPHIDLSTFNLQEASRVAKALSTVLSLAERVNDDETIVAFTPLAKQLLEVGVPRKWSSQSALIGLANRSLTTLDDIGSVITFLEAAHHAAPNNFELIKSLAVASMVNDQNGRAKQLVRQALQRSPNDRSLLTLLARAHENNADISDALGANTKALNILESSALENSESGDLVNSVLALRNTTATQRFWIETSKITHLVPAPRSETIKGVVFGSFYRCMTSASISSVPLLELKRRGYDVVYLNSGTLSAEPTGHKLLDQFSSIIHGDGSFVRGTRSNRAKLFHNWVVDPANRQITVDGLNFYQPIFERLTQESRSFTLDFSSGTVQRRIRGMILRCDRALYVAERIRDEVAAKGIPVRFVSANWQYPPYCAFRIACQAWAKDYDMSFVAVSPGYESYFANLGKRFSTTAAALNMTLNPTSRAPFLPIGEKFARWYDANQGVVEATEGEIREQIQADRAGTGSTLLPEAEVCFERVQAHRARGGKVVGAFGKIVYDLAVPYAGGPAHVDMADYINHTVEAATKAPDTLLLVKPHPHELRYEIARNPREYFTDLIKVPLPPNVILLGHRWFNVRDMIKMIDLGILWNGTTSVELGASGIPVVMCDDWGPHDYPVGHAAPRDRAHYEAIIKDPSLITIDDAYQQRCIGLLKYLSTTDVMRPYEFVTRGLVNVDVGPPAWHLDAVQDYLKNGNEYISALADDFMF